MAYSDAITKEVAWYTTDPPQPSGFTPPALIKANGGSFDVIQAFPRKVSRRQRDLYLFRSSVKEERVAFGGRKRYVHRMVCKILWPVSAAAIEADMQRCDVAIEQVLTRIRGPLGDNSHGGRFTSAGDNIFDLDVIYEDPFLAATHGSPLEVRIPYVLYEDFVA